MAITLPKSTFNSTSSKNMDQTHPGITHGGISTIPGLQPVSIPPIRQVMVKPMEAAKGPKTVKKSPLAPKRFKSSFIFFSMAKHKEIKEKIAAHGRLGAKATNITRMVSDAWRSMGDEERQVYEEMARKDKERYELEKANYDGPIGGPGSRKQKDPNAPKRPMSAFLAFANSRRAEVKANNPECTNGEISKILSRMWKEANDDIKQGYRDREAQQWRDYKVGIVEYRKKNDGRKKQAKEENKSFGDLKKKKKVNKDKESSPSMESIQMPLSMMEEPQDLASVSFGGQLNAPIQPNQEEIMAASALHGVRGGGGVGVGNNSNNLFGDSSMDQFNPSQSNNGLGQFFQNTAGSGVGNHNFSDLSGTNNSGSFGNTGSLLQMGFPMQQIQQLGGLGSLTNNPAMLMALQGSLPTSSLAPLMGLSNADQQHPLSLSQLASLASQPLMGTQSNNSGGMMGDNNFGGFKGFQSGDNGSMQDYQMF